MFFALASVAAVRHPLDRVPAIVRMLGIEFDGADADVEADAVLYIVEGTQLCYGSKRAWDVASR